MEDEAIKVKTLESGAFFLKQIEGKSSSLHISTF